MEKTKEIPKIKDNGEKSKLTKAEIIQQLEQELEQLRSSYQFKSGYLACLKEDN